MKLYEHHTKILRQAHLTDSCCVNARAALKHALDFVSDAAITAADASKRTAAMCDFAAFHCAHRTNRLHVSLNACQI
jgi:hypothetical protein